MVNGYTNRICGIGLPPKKKLIESEKSISPWTSFLMVPKTISIILILEIISKRGRGT